MYGYFCNICNKDHQMNSKIGKEHLPHHLKFQEEEGKKAEEERAKQKPVSDEEREQRLYKSIFGDV